jgi:hypothetical protein
MSDTPANDTELVDPAPGVTADSDLLDDDDGVVAEARRDGEADAPGDDSEASGVAAPPTPERTEEATIDVTNQAEQVRVTEADDFDDLLSVAGADDVAQQSQRDAGAADASIEEDAAAPTTDGDGTAIASDGASGDGATRLAGPLPPPRARRTPWPS